MFKSSLKLVKIYYAFKVVQLNHYRHCLKTSRHNRIPNSTKVTNACATGSFQSLHSFVSKDIWTWTSFKYLYNFTSNPVHLTLVNHCNWNFLQRQSFNSWINDKSGFSPHDAIWKNQLWGNESQRSTMLQNSCVRISI